uniref:Peptidase A1 domain-containing protein n=1 Tax=Rodentolepis nana TaxID=102285 RepID=A0A0R3TZM5_RODNA
LVYPLFLLPTAPSNAPFSSTHPSDTSSHVEAQDGVDEEGGGGEEEEEKEEEEEEEEGKVDDDKVVEEDEYVEEANNDDDVGDDDEGGGGGVGGGGGGGGVEEKEESRAHSMRDIVGSLLLILLLFCRIANGLHLSGVWSTDKVYTFLARFAFQKTSVAEIEGTRGYIFGNISSLDYSFNSSDRMPPATLVIVDGEYVTDLYGNASRPVQLFSDSTNGSHFNLWQAETARCQAMFSRINTLAWHRKCSPKAKMDFLRQAPCTTGGLCSEEEEPSRVQPLSQFTFTVQDRRQPRTIVCNESYFDSLILTNKQ